jgi:GH15 family glucan-1,4-alpha-glucosidase
MAYQPIESYGIIGNMQTVALVNLNGAIDWLCLPHLDSPSVFGALLDDSRGGRFLIQPADDFDSVAEYVHRTNVLVTTFRTRTGVMKLTDFMAVSGAESQKRQDGVSTLYRLVSVEEGAADVRMVYEPRFDYARAKTVLSQVDGSVLAQGENQDVFLALRCSKALECAASRATATWHLQAGDTVCMAARSGADDGKTIRTDMFSADIQSVEETLRETERYWRDWLDKSETGRVFSFGQFRDMIERSALVLKLLYYEPAGTIAAAATTSLPEDIGGVRNWDYRFTWVRDTSFTLQALFNVGHLSEMEGYLHWLERVLQDGVETMQIMYGLRGERDIRETELAHLDGYKGSRPVRIGNGAFRQRQMDIYGELMDAALKLANYVGKITVEQWPVLREICEYVAGHWQEKDFGIWEVRNGPWHFVYSKVLCWVALDRGITIAERYGFDADTEEWLKVKERIKAEVLDRGFSDTKEAFVQHYETDALDASSLLIPMLGFLPFDDCRVISTVEAVAKELTQDGLLYRYSGEDGLAGEEGTFLLCSFWLADCLIHMGRLEEAEQLLQRLEATANHLGLFAEEYDVERKQLLGNFPQAFTHIGYITSVVYLLRAKEERQRQEQKRKGLRVNLAKLLRKRVPATKLVLNEGTPDSTFPVKDLAVTLRSTMNLLRGAFFDISRGRVAYERMGESSLYADYKKLALNLQRFDPGCLTSTEERTAFWINLYNVIIIHGVIELDITDSVREVSRFFRRIRYRIGQNCYTPDDIEHGILRANKRPPHSLFRVFGKNDDRKNYSLEQIDPRIHFALVCASSSCPPIDVYTAENLDEEFDQAAKTFLNGGGLQVDKKRMKVSLSRVFRWYGSDFKAHRAEQLRWLADYLYDREDRQFLQEHAGTVTVSYQKYDWRLNRG